jgi:ABC-type antimicrobial peptide transport system permease subunit
MMMGQDNADVEIVGVVKDSKYGSLREKSGNFIYVPYDQAGDEFTRQCTFFVRAGGNDRAVMPAVRAAVKQADSAIPINNMTSMQVMIDNSVSTDRLIAALAVAFAILASVLAAVGLYGTISYSVARRTREFGIRLVLGAAPQSLLLFVMREVGWLTAIGIAIGLPMSYALARVVESQLYGVQAHDPVVLVLAAILIVGVAFTAALAPALRATRIQPLQAIRYE